VVLAAVRTYIPAMEDFQHDREVVLEAVRNDRDALKFASEDLKMDPVLQPGKVAGNCIAGLGALAPLLCLRSVTEDPAGGLEASVVLGLGAERDASMAVPSGGENPPTVGDLASFAVQHFGVEGGLVHVHVQGHGRMGVLDVDRSLRGFL